MASDLFHPTRRLSLPLGDGRAIVPNFLNTDATRHQAPQPGSCYCERAVEGITKVSYNEHGDKSEDRRSTAP